MNIGNIGCGFLTLGSFAFGWCVGESNDGLVLDILIGIIGIRIWFEEEDE